MPEKKHILPADAYESINNRIRSEVEANNQESSWLPSYVEQQTQLYLHPDYLEPRLPYFRTMLLQGGPIAWPDCQAVNYGWYSTNPLGHQLRAFRVMRGYRANFRSILRKLHCPITDFDEDLIGYPYHTRKLLFYGKPETEANIRYSFYYGLLSKYVPLERVSAILEIGGGFGGLIGRIGQKWPEIRLYAVELPQMSILVFYYLKTKLGAQLVWQKPYDFNSYRVNVLLPWMLEDTDVPVDLAINTMSFQHMDKRNLHFYFTHLQKMGVKRIFSINRETAVNQGEVPYLDVMRNCSDYELEDKVPLEPWSRSHFIHLLRLRNMG